LIVKIVNVATLQIGAEQNREPAWTQRTRCTYGKFTCAFNLDKRLCKKL